MKRTTYDGRRTAQISLPLGGLGTGSVGLAGNGRLVDWEIFGTPNKGSDNGPSHFAVKAERSDGEIVAAKILNGDVYDNLAGQPGKNYGSGLPNTTMAGFPHFRKCVFKGEFPIARIEFSDSDFPGEAEMTAFNPFIPHNADDSGIPAAFFEFEVRNTSDEDLDYTVAASLRNPQEKSVNEASDLDGGSAVWLRGEKREPDDFGLTDLTLEGEKGCARQRYWYRGGWWDGVETFWTQFARTKGQTLPDRVYDVPGNYDMATLCEKKHIAAGDAALFRFVIAWNHPNRRNYWDKYTQKNEKGEDVEVPIRNYYAFRFADSRASADYAFSNWERLLRGTLQWHDALFGSSLPDEVIEAVSATSSVLKTETLWRIGEKGDIYGWEGLWEHNGSCEGTCTHVWNYAYALPFLFPELERNIRENDYNCNQEPTGKMVFRTRIPFGRGRGSFRACVDGTMGGVMKTYRDWKLCGDDEWLRSIWPKVKKSLDYATSPDNPDHWDSDADGVLEGRGHHTLDMELFGPSSWLEGFYLGALKAASEMAEHLGESGCAAVYRSLYERGRAFCDRELFNGRYYAQKIDLSDRSVLERFGADAVNAYWNDEAGQIKYQIGDGCLLDQVMPQWHADISGLGDLYDKAQLETSLDSLMKYNFKHDMRSHYNTFRLFAINDEAGAIICTYPEGSVQPAIPIPYAQESMHGFEYAFAGLLASRGRVSDARKVVRGVRDRYDGEKRNPYNEIECGSNYARSMAAFSLVPIWSGFSFDMTRGEIGFAPIGGSYRGPWFVGGAWGDVLVKNGRVRLHVTGGELVLSSFAAPGITDDSEVKVDGQPVQFRAENGTVRFGSPVTIHRKLTVK